MNDEPKKKGRPRKHPLERKRYNHTVRLRECTRATLQARAKQNARSVSEEIEAIIERDLLLQDVRETIRQEFADARLQSAGLTKIEPEDWIRAYSSRLGSNLTNFERKDGFTYLGPVIGKQPDCQ